MNERIKELFRQAGGKSSKRNLASNPVQVVEAHELWDEHIDKFAELIVRECARIANEKEEGFPQYDKDMSVHWYILKNFGVEK